MSKLYFVRHGESEWNVADKICGRTDIPLTKRGHEQAEETGKKIVAEGIKADEILYSRHIWNRGSSSRILACGRGLHRAMRRSF